MLSATIQGVHTPSIRESLFRARGRSCQKGPEDPRGRAGGLCKSRPARHAERGQEGVGEGEPQAASLRLSTVQAPRPQLGLSSTRPFQQWCFPVFVDKNSFSKNAKFFSYIPKGKWGEGALKMEWKLKSRPNPTASGTGDGHGG